MTAAGIDERTPRGSLKRNVTGGGATYDVIGPNGLYSERLSNRVELGGVSIERFENWALDLAGCELAFPKASSCS